MSSSSSSNNTTPVQSTRKRPIVKYEESDDDGDQLVDSSPSPKKKPREDHKKTSSKADAWSPEMRLKLFDAFDKCAQIKWDEIAKMVGGGKKASECRQQWSRATGKKIRKALLEGKD